MNTCLVKYFGDPEITREDVVNILKNLLFACTLNELQKLEESRGVPPCVRLLIAAAYAKGTE
jgi:hypothetical protein